MTDVVEMRAAQATPTPLEGLARVLVRRLSTDNPFYVLSALLVFVGLKTSFGAQMRPEQTWALMFGLAGYTLLLAGPACLLVRIGGVWEDVRTVLLLVVLMFLATSVTIDEALSRDPELGLNCSVAGLIFAVAVSEGILRGIRLDLPPWFRGPYYLALALFFLYPAALLPLLDRPRSEALEWALFGFSPAAGLIALTLLPAARRGPEYLRENGSPWRWPLYPWVLFGLLGLCVAARSFLLCWSMQHVEIAETEQLIFGPYFLIPFGFAVAVLLLEIALGSGNRGVMLLTMLAPVALVFLATIGHRPDSLYQEFLRRFVERLGGTPLYLTLLATAIFYTYAVTRRVPEALGWLTTSLGALAFVGPATFDLHDLAAPRFWPLLALAVLELGLGLSRRETRRSLIGLVCLTAASIVLPTISISHRGPLAAHLALAGVLTLGAIFDDRLARRLRGVGAVAGIAAALMVQAGWAKSVAPWSAIAYPLVMMVVLCGYGLRLGHIPSLAAVPIVLTGEAVVFFGRGYRYLQGQIVGLNFIVMGLVLLAVAQAISASKAGLLSRWSDRGKEDMAEPWI